MTNKEINIFSFEEFNSYKLNANNASVLLDTSKKISSDFIKVLLENGVRNFFIFGEYTIQTHELIDTIYESYLEKYENVNTIDIDNEDFNDLKSVYFLFRTFENYSKSDKYIIITDNESLKKKLLGIIE